MTKNAHLFSVALWCMTGLGALSFLAIPAYAQNPVVNPEQVLQRVEQQGLVPCGTSVTNKTPCHLCDAFKLAKNITDFIMAAGFIITAGMIGVGGFMILAGSYSEAQVEQGKKTLTAAIVGLIIILFAWLMIDTTIKVLVGDVNILDTSNIPAMFNQIGPWNNFQCQVYQP